MPSNAWTKQTPKSGSVIRAVLAERVYIAPVATVWADPSAKLNGTAPAGAWVDLGIVANSQVSLSYNKEMKYVETGIERVRRGSYITQKTAQATFTLEQFDMGVLEPVSGLVKDALSGGAAGNKLHIGQEDIVTRSLLCYGTNKIDNKEFIMYAKSADITFQIQSNDDYRVLAVTCELFPFVPTSETEEAYFSLYVLD